MLPRGPCMLLNDQKIFMQNNLMTNIYGNLVSTLISFFVILFAYLLFQLFFVRKIENSRQKQKVHIRSFYVMCVIFIFMMAHVWVDGFTHLLTILGLVSAGLVVSNKETIMNFVGWLVITWRGLFSEDDLIQVQQYKGYVKRIGILYFTLYEVSELGGGVTGRLIRVPNGLITSNPIINYSQTSQLLEQCFTLSVSKNNDFDYLKTFAKTVIDAALTELYDGKRDLVLANRARAKTRVSLQPSATNLSSVNLLVWYFCSSQDVEKMRERILLSFLQAAQNEKLIHLA